MNKIQIEGFVGGDPEVRNLANGGKVVSFSVATQESWKAGGEWKTRDTWHRVESFRAKDIELIQAQVSKGTRVRVEGMLRIETFGAKGARKTACKVLMAARDHSLIVVPYERRQAA